MPIDPNSPSGSPHPGDDPTTPPAEGAGATDADAGARPSSAADAPTTQMPRSDDGPRRLLRSSDDRVLAGVCAGVAKYFNIDPLIVRIAVVAATFVGGAGLIAYLAAALLVPADDGSGRAVEGSPSRAATIAGAILVVLLGVAALNGDIGVGAHTGWAAVPFGVALVLFAAFAIRVTRREDRDQPPLVRVLRVAVVMLGALVACAMLAVGAAWATAAGGGAIVAGAVIAVGVAMVALALRGHAAAWLAVPALALAVPAGIVSAAGVDLDGGVGDRSYAPTAVADVRPGGYELGAGQLVVDLRRMRWPKDAPVALHVRAGVGQALVLVPRDVCVEAHAKAGAGYVDVLGHDFGGADVDDAIGTTAHFTGRRLVVDGDVGLGALEIRHHKSAHGWDDGHDRRFGAEAGSDPIAPPLLRAGCAGEAA